MIRGLSLEAKIGQMLMFGFSGTEVTPFIEHFITKNNLGGIIHFNRNVKNVRQLVKLNQSLQELTKQAPGKTDLLIAADQEGGTVARLTSEVLVPPSAMALGATKNEEIVEGVATISGLELRATGINMNLAPAVDVNNNPKNPVIGVRSFGEDAYEVAKYGVATIRGLQKNVAAVAKHFPGHGDTEIDSHHALPLIAHTRKRLERIELVPFKAAIEAEVAGILAAHVVFPAIEPQENLPATLSYNVLTRLLREELGYQGLIITDCMEMSAMTESFGTVEGAVMTVEAGSDIIIISHTEKLQQGAFDALVKAVKTGRISEERIDQSVERILKVKSKYQIEGQNIVGDPHNRQFMQKAIRQGITLVQDQGNLPLGEEKVLVVEFKEGAKTGAEDVLADLGTLSAALRKYGLSNFETCTISYRPTAQEKDLVLEQAKACEKVVVVTSDAHLNPELAALVQKLLIVNRNVIAIGSRTPYELAVFEDISTYVAAYGSRPMVWEQVAQILLGKFKASGQLPVTIKEVSCPRFLK